VTRPRPPDEPGGPNDDPNDGPSGSPGDDWTGGWDPWHPRGRAGRRVRRGWERGGWGPAGRGLWGPPGRAGWDDARLLESRRRWAGRRHRGPGPRFFGCLFLALVLVVGGIAALATWVAAALLGFLAPGAAPSFATSFLVLGGLVVVAGLAARGFSRTVRPLAEIAAATERLADGEPGVRVRTTGPRSVRSLGASFNAMAERLDRSREDRKALLADVTHELRTPLTVIAGGLEAMTDGVHPMDEDHIAPLLAETEQMSRLLDDLRTISLAEAGALPLHREAVDLREIADDVVAAQGPIAAGRGVALRAAGDATLETSVDPVRVREILTNLVANAARHTQAGGSVEVRVGRAGAEAVLEVADTGEGIPAADLPHVFDRFQRRADSGGSGLGLAIVRDLAAAHGGTVEAESEGIAGRGSRFRVRLPLRD
jgi:signal transduction histidine kinase